MSNGYLSENHKAAIEYAEMGLKVLPLRTKGKAPKAPIHEAWQQHATDDVEIVDEWWRENPERNVGVRLGECSGILDIEVDDNEGESEAEDLLLKIFGGESPYTPTYMSKKGRHRLFKYRPDLPLADKNGFSLGKLEFRTGNSDKGAQSVFPPARSPSKDDQGRTVWTDYKWIIHPGECEFLELTDEIIGKIHELFHEFHNKDGGEASASRTPDEWVKVLSSDCIDGERNVVATSLIGRQLGKMKNPNDANDLQLEWINFCNWNQLYCKPPLELDVMDTVFESILGREKAKRSKELTGEDYSEDNEFVGNKEKVEWKIVIVNSDPRVFRIYSPLWSYSCKRGYIECNAKELLDGRMLRVIVAEQAIIWLPASFKTLWQGGKDADGKIKKGKGAELMACATAISAPMEEQRELWLTDQIFQELMKADTTLIDDRKGANINAPSKINQGPNEGEIIFKFNKIANNVRNNNHGENVTRNELSKILRLYGATDVQVTLGDKNSTDGKTKSKAIRHRFFVLSKDQLRKMEQAVASLG